MAGSNNFFVGKRPWSKIKDRVLGEYMVSYIAKVNRRGQPILLVDGYAGPGIFDDDTEGSPFIICKAAEKYAKGNYQAFFINKDKKHHNQLSQAIEKAGWSSSAKTILSDSTLFLQQLPYLIHKQTLFLYLDPFGLKGCEFDLLKPFLGRNSGYSTEILLTMNMNILHRLATRHAVKNGRQNEPRIKSYHQRLTQVFGGEYWQDILWQSTGRLVDRETQLIDAYRERLAKSLPITGACPVREKADKRIKYFMVFASHHEDSIILLNDIMAKAYFSTMHKEYVKNGLWEGTDWRDTRSIGNLTQDIIEMVAQHPRETRESIWFRIVQKHFMRYLKPEYNAAVQRLVDNKTLISPTPRKTKRLNENCTLYPP